MAKSFYITRIQSTNGTKTYTLNETSGLFTCSDTNEPDANIMDFICKSNYKIAGVKKTIDGIPFLIGSRVSTGQKITEIKIIGGIVHLMLSDNSVLLLNDAQHYVELQPVVNTTNQSQPNNQNSAILNLENIIISKYPRPIRLASTLRKRKETPKNFLIKFFQEWNASKATIYCDNGDVQTATGKRRSLGDIFMIMKYYYPNITLTEVLRLLYNDLYQHYNVGFRSSYCNTIHKRVWYFAGSNINLLQEHTDEYGHDVLFYKSRI